MPDIDSSPPAIAGIFPDRKALVFVLGSLDRGLAVWLADSGHDVVVVEVSPGASVSSIASRERPNIRYIADKLPGLHAMFGMGLIADVIMINGVWENLSSGERPRTFRKLVSMLRSGGAMVTPIGSPSDQGDVTKRSLVQELSMLGRANGMVPIDISAPHEEPGTRILGLRVPDDATGALPLLRRIILSDQKSSTYKLALLRALCRAAQGSGGMVCEDGDDYVRLPLGLLALNWIRLYMPLTAANLPQAPANRNGVEGLAFAGRGWRAIAGSSSLRQDLRVGREFFGSEAMAIRSALRDAARLIRDMPAKHMKFQSGHPILEISPGETLPRASRLILDEATLASFGTARIPRYLWLAMQKLVSWIEPVLVAEWVRQMHAFADGHGRQLDASKIAVAMRWSDPERTTGVPRHIALARMANGQPLYCVWSGKRLTEQNLDIDHCIPWSAWPCSDLWNLLPCDRRVNQHQKRERLPSISTLHVAMDAMVSWWGHAYLQSGDISLRRRFDTEAYASLPNLGRATERFDLEDVYAALRILQVRLAHDQGIPEWNVSAAKEYNRRQ